jgi:mevalonate kinase
MFRQISVSAPSKLILHGEHAVVYGKSAVASSLDLRTRMQIIPLAERVIEVDFPDVGVSQRWYGEDVQHHILDQRPESLYNQDEIDEDFLSCIHAFLSGEEDREDLKLASLTCFFYLYSLLCKDFVPMKIKVESEIPIGAGLGSSAALSVCLASGLYAIKTDDSTLDNGTLKHICQLALVSEKILHGKPSGIDNSVSTYGGLIHFRHGQVVQIKPPKDFQLRILLVNTKVTRTTKELVDRVKNQYHKHPTVIRPIMEAIDGVAKSFLATLTHMNEAGDTRDKYENLNDLIVYNQKLLESLGVSHSSLDDVIATARSLGLKAKLTGAGGGGFAYILLPPFVSEDDICQVKDKLTKRGYTCCETRLGVNGVRIQFDNSDNNECIS